MQTHQNKSTPTLTAAPFAVTQASHNGAAPARLTNLELDGSGSVFQVDPADSDIQRRLSEHDIHPTAILPGVGKVLEQGEALDWQQQQLMPWHHWVDGLVALNVNTERRAVRLVPKALSYQWLHDTLELSFALPAGCFATSVLRELVNYRDCGGKATDLE